MSLKNLASLLNQDGITAPNDGGRGNKLGRGWGHTTIRAMPSNERYLGRVTWNQSKWLRVPGRKSRRRVARPANEWVTQTYPELAIIDESLWGSAQGRFQRTHAKGRGRPAGTGQQPYLLSGLLRCGVCGGSMTVVGRKAKAGVSYARLGCTAHSSRGASICANALSISERKASAALMAALRSKFSRPELIERFVASFEQRVAERQREAAQVPTAAGAIEDCERRIANLTEALAKVGWSDALASKLRDEERSLTQLRAKRAAELKERTSTRPTQPDRNRRLSR